MSTWIRCSLGVIAAFALAACSDEDARYPEMEETPGGEEVAEAREEASEAERDAREARREVQEEVSEADREARQAREEAMRMEERAASRVEVVPGSNTPLDGPPPSLKLTSPRPGTKIVRGDVVLRGQLRNWELQPGGNHVHLIVDNEPYIAVYDMSQPLNLDALMQEHLGMRLEPGTHAIRMFPSRGNHESVKEGRPFVWSVFHYQQPTEDFAFDPTAPLLTYSRPKGCNVLGERVLLDFYLTNVGELTANGYRVRYTIDGETSGELTRWVPYYVLNLDEGEHRVRLQLIGEDGEVVSGPFNDTTRAFRMAAMCPPEDMPMQSPNMPGPTEPDPPMSPAPGMEPPGAEPMTPGGGMPQFRR